jgi:mono/diheme cytochrome c family protein
VRSLLLAPSLLSLATATVARPAPDAFEASVRPILARSCFSCHNAMLRNADLNLEAYESRDKVVADPHTWEKVVTKVRTGVMPPAGFPALSEGDVKTVTEWIEATLAKADEEAPPDPGRVTARRLNRTEYDNTVRDLLGVDLRPADDFAQDDAGYGFDNIGDVLSVSPALMERYVTAAERVARAALFGADAPKPALVRLQAARGKIEPSPIPLFDYDTTGLSLPNAVHALHRFPVGAEYVIRVMLGGERPAASAPLPMALWIDDRRVAALELDPEGGASFFDDRQDLSGKIREFRTRVAAGEHHLAVTIERLYEGLPPSCNGPNPSTRPAPPPRVFEPPKDASPEKIAEARKHFEERQAEKPPVNQARVARVEVLGPYAPETGPSATSLQRVYACGHLHGGHGPGCARTILSAFTRRAYRRPVTSADVEPLMGLVSGAQKRGESFEGGLGLALQAVLVSPDFLFRIEKGRPTDGTGPGQPVSDYELASRLSYFLWASMPDDALLLAADRGVLRKPEVLSAQVRRMLKDDKASALVESFGGQWLQFRALEGVAPDRDRFPDFENDLRLSMRRETELFVLNLIREDRSILDLVDGQYTFLNERLARHYGIPGVKGPEFRRVDLSGTARGGVLTQASVLTVSSYATRTSPVLRGKWILENVLNAPPPAPPPGTPRLDEAKVGGEASLRKQLEAHRTGATCAACHSKMDPLGFSLENFDAIGAWRNEDGKWPIDNAGVLPDGRSFAGPDGLKAILRSDREAFAECVTHKLLTYALGRGLERYDRRTVAAIASRLEASDYRFSALVLEIVESLPFQRRRAEAPS